MKRILILLVFGSFLQTQAQDQAMGIPMFWTNAGGSLPGGDLADQFGANALVGGSFMQKFTNGWMLGFESSAIFGNQIKNEKDFFLPIANQKEDFLTNDGTIADIRLFQRGLKLGIHGGKLLPIIGPNPNSGLLLLGGLGFMQHKVRIEVINNNVPVLDREGKKSFDRYTDGLSLSQFIGYFHLSNNRRINYYFGFEVSEGFTRNRRSFNMYSQGPDNRSRLDMMYSLKVGWILPLYKKTSQTFYYN